MKIGKTILAFLLATLTLTLVACRSEKKNLTESSGDDVSSRQSQSQPQESFSFTTTDLDGHEVSFEDYSDAKVIMFNMWEPWCGPCRGELPDLQRLYKKYKSEGLMIVGVYSDTDGLEDIVRENKIKYPMILSCEAFDRFQTGYVPTTVFIDGSGRVLSDEPYVGSKTYEEWESVILSYLK
ncbi:MAG: TlpA family protein disulfide reductase [Clostridia bacterium]|nr:TlpA family protein disulfide reductase [Clostridia bacterium]